MKFLKFGALLTVLAVSLMACSSSTEKTATTDNSAAPAEPAATPEPPPPPAPKMVTVPAGTVVHVALSQSLSSSKNTAGDKFEAVLTSPLEVGGTTVLEKGATVHGSVVDAKDSGRVKGLASLTLALIAVEQDGKTIAIDTKNFVQEAKTTKKKDAKIIGGVAAIGTAIGAIAGGKKGAAEGAAIGAGAGAGTVLATKGEDVEFGPETKINFTLEKSVELAAAK